jgi:hypothetical protein
MSILWQNRWTALLLLVAMVLLLAAGATGGQR